MYCTLLYWDLIMILIIVPLLVILCIQCVGVLCLHLQLQWAHNPTSSNIVLFIWLLCSKRLSEWVSELREENEWIKWMNECSMCVCVSVIMACIHDSCQQTNLSFYLLHVIRYELNEGPLWHTYNQLPVN